MKERIALWDNLKFLLITTVVIGHFAYNFTDVSLVTRSVYLFIYSFHMPLFIYISGLFHSDKNITTKIVFYCSVGFIQKFIYVIMNYFSGNNVTFNLLGDGAVPWFMFVLAIFTFLGYILRNQNKIYILIFSLVLACFAGYDNNIGDYLYIARSVNMFPFYLLGMVTNLTFWTKLKRKMKFEYRVLLPILIIGIWMFLCFYKLDIFYNYRYMFSGRNPYLETGLSYGFVVRILCYILSIVMGICLILITPMRNMKYISLWGTRTINVLVFHLPIYNLLYYIFNIEKLFYGFWGKIIFYSIAILLTVVLSFKIFDYPLSILKKIIYTNNEVNEKSLEKV